MNVVAAKGRCSPALLTVLLAGLATLGPFSIDTYLPAFPAIERSLAATPLQMQQSIAAYLASFGAMMLFHGAISDSLGRKPVILAGLAVFALASIGCALATSIEMLLAFRVLQGVSAGGGIVVGRAIVRDAYAGADAQRVMSHVTMIFGLAPAVAPVLGGVLLAVADWRAIFWFLALFAAALLAVCAARLPETHPRAARQPLRAGALFANYARIAGTGRFVLLALAIAFNFAGFFLYVLGAPAVIYDHLRLGATDFAWLFVPQIGGVMFGAWLSGRAAGRTTPERTVAAGYAIMACAALLNAGYHALFAPALPWSVLVLCAYAVGMSLAMPSLTLLALDLFPALRGSAASLQGFVQSCTNATAAVAAVPLLSGAMLHMACGTGAALAAGAGCWLAYLMLARRHRPRRAAVATR